MLLIISGLTVACSSRQLDRNDNTVYLTPSATKIHENEKPTPVTLVVSRDNSDTSIQVKLLLEGEAIPGEDYKIDGAMQESTSTYEVTMTDGQSSVEFMVTTIDDLVAEAGETIQISLSDSDQYRVDRKSGRVAIEIPMNDYLVTNTLDSGEGSLRQAMLNANMNAGPDEIRFDSETGPFGPPQEIVIESPLPAITESLVLDGFIDGFLWQQAGVIISGDGSHRIISVKRGATATIKNVTLADGKARSGGGILNRGKLIASGITFLNNNATNKGGAIANLSGDLWVINSTFTGNRAKRTGGGISNLKGRLTVTNSTLSENSSKRGGALFNKGSLALNNTILANSDAEQDCYSADITDSTGTHNIIEINGGCPGVLFEMDPGLGSLEYYNGMTQTFSLNGLSLAMNIGDNASAVDEEGTPLQWDQRGNGDPRFVAGITDIGAFEVQAYPKLVVDTLQDGGPQGCSGMMGDCPLRAAIRLAELNNKPDTITFDPRVFTEATVLVLEKPLTIPLTEIVLDASNVSPITVRMGNNGRVFEAPVPKNLEVRGLEFQ